MKNLSRRVDRGTTPRAMRPVLQGLKMDCSVDGNKGGGK